MTKRTGKQRTISSAGTTVRDVRSVRVVEIGHHLLIGLIYRTGELGKIATGHTENGIETEEPSA